ncbi:GNAT family N-acetyltransferase [Acidaminobacter sp. JC074]|uniref:GNAT family N-acetyltransferase n=1 Tax=Acidaminobacter sp. JC074 TaxID=2530199 RepID=UPI001F114F33|nr:GNAT family N-acetyltransferase [Acidaminobacter sp. JC074]MCH4886084.1 GNAT family N-acetyltransferase [Acidaminobacter sp. JC074]
MSNISIQVYKTFEADVSKGLVPSTIYDIFLDETVIGKLSLRIGDNENIYYGGHLGYTIDEPYRGNNYAYQACMALKEIAIEKGLTHIIITCNPDNMASKRVCEKLGAQLIEEVDVPEYNDMYQRGEKKKIRYRWTL